MVKDIGKKGKYKFDNKYRFKYAGSLASSRLLPQGNSCVNNFLMG